MKLNEIKDNQGARLKSKRLGRGEGSGVGKTCGRGVKGQKSRSGVAIKGFEGGQNPLYMRMPKRGFNNKDFKTVFGELNLSDLQAAVDAKKLDAGKEITIETLKAAGLVRPARENVKILGNGELKTALNLVVSKATKSAVAAIEKAKGSVKQLHVEPAPAASA
ncbi:MAG: 50S ribosomal protein L15 [Alphaproteobacteria bacterium]|nr:50S ribosomal protein L15 [Alphaproteobacteria bacterium]NCQ66530.1 50S ribosomal protein L15 [Alphaproteobacteria bacterium]NCT08321.1 50S ribosomal protein L15 [Alphaproteobacteria bacterium]